MNWTGKRMKTALALLLALLCALSCAVPALAAGEGDVGAQIEAYVQEHEDTLAGMAVSVFDADAVEYEDYFGFADREAGVPVTEDTVFDWGSVTKLTVWISVMQLWEQGKLDLEADIRDYLPEGFLTRLKYNEPITMIHLMNHQGGFEDAVMGMDTPDERDILPLEDYLYRYQPAQVYEPGTVTAYSNWSTTLAGYIVERVSGEPFYQYVQNHLFKPIGIEHAALNSDLSDDPWVKERRLALRGYDTKGDPLRGPFEYVVPYPCGMCASPLRELRRFAQELLKHDTVWFQSPETYYEMFSPTAFYGDTDLALNSHGFWHIRCYATPVVGHGGNTPGCSSNLLLDPESGRGMVVMVNQQTESVFTHLMAETVFGKGEWEKPDYRGWLESARITYSGLMKVYHIVSTFSPANAEVVYESDFCVRGTSGGVEKICSCYGDYLVRTPGEVLPMSLMLGWGALGIVFAVVILLWRGVACLVRRGKRCPVDGLAVAASALSLAAGGMILGYATSLLSLAMWRPGSYRLWSVGMLVLMCALAAVCVWGVLSFRKLKTKGRKALRVIALVAAAGVAANIAYWNLFMFWTA
ncbi:MAG: beta-lactamase family protein [Clostridia bacterium]|nr:beta-lactamase family protein [Clostridia bacterium]